MSAITIEKQSIETTSTDAINPIISVPDFQVWTTSFSPSVEQAKPFASTIRRAFKEGKLDALIKRAEADYDAGRALDTLD
jgi:hypothetical protein